MPTRTPERSISLYFSAYVSDKVYHIQVIHEGVDQFHVSFQYGRRGNTLTAGKKTTSPVSLVEAQKIYDRLLKEKQAKGYSPGVSGVRYEDTPHAPRYSGLQPQLLNAIDEDDLDSCLASHSHLMQEKVDGRRLQIQKDGKEIVGNNKLGLIVSLPETLVHAVRRLEPRHLVLDGEVIGSSLWAFDILALNQDLRSEPYSRRYAQLRTLGIDDKDTTLRLVQTAIDPPAKRDLFTKLKRELAEGVVFKDMGAPYSAGRPNRGGPQVKYKFTATASCLVKRHNAKRSVAIGLLAEDGSAIDAGNVTIPGFQNLPALDSIIEVQYLYAFPGSSKLYQPVYLGVRDDIRREECLTTQLKFRQKLEEDEL